MEDRHLGASTPELAYWRTNIRLVCALLCVWAFVSYGCGILFVETLNTVKLGGYPLGFWFAQQGSIFVFVALILTYCLVMDRADAALEEE